MIVSHKFKFIFVKTRKTAGTSIEVLLSQLCDDRDIVTPIGPHVEPHRPRNYQGRFNPFPELVTRAGYGWRRTLKDWHQRNKFWSHIPARLIRARLAETTWNEYFKFCVERNPWDKAISHYFWMKDRVGGQLSLEEYFARGDFVPNAFWYTDRKGKVIVDKVLRYEHLLDDLAALFKRLGVPFDGDLGVRAKSEHRTDRRPYQEVLSDKQRRTIELVCAQEISIHGYQF